MISVYTDGSSTGRSERPGGWGYVIVNSDGEVLCVGAGGSPQATNNTMELEAAIRGLARCIKMGLDSQTIELVSDSQYVLGLASGRYTPLKNKEQAAALRALAKQAGCQFRWVKGHGLDKWNEKCDQLAKHEKQKLLDQEKSDDAIGI